MTLIINNLTGTTKTYLSGAVTVPANSSTNITSSPQVLSLCTDGQFRSDLISVSPPPPIQISDGTTTYGGNDALSYLSILISVIMPISDGVGNNISSTSNGSKRALDINITNTSNNPSLIKFSASDQITNVGRLKVANQQILLDASFGYNLQPLYLNTKTVGSATITYSSTDNGAYLSTTTNSTDSAILQSKAYIKYNAGGCYRSAIGAVPGTTPTNITKKLGYFDSNNGIFFQFTSSGPAVVIRSDTSGSPTDTIITQANWNLDKLDGTGPSGITLDLTKYNVFVIEFSWQGASSVRFGILVNEGQIFCHEFTNFNDKTTPYMSTGSLPIRGEITNTGTAGSTSTLKLYSVACQSEENIASNPNIIFSTSNGVTALSTTNTAKPLISLRPASTFNGNVNRISIIPSVVQILAGSQNTLIQLYQNATLTGASWISVNTNSAAQYDISATAFSGGTKVLEFYVPASSGLLQPTVSNITGTTLQRLLLALNIDGTSQDSLTVVATSLAGGTNTYGSIQWIEEQ